MKIIQVKAFEYNELDEQSKISARHWLDEDPFEYETEDEEGVPEQNKQNMGNPYII